MEPVTDSSDSATSSEGIRRRLGQDRYSEDVWGVQSGGVIGIRINHRIEYEMTFRLCLSDVFGRSFSDHVAQRRRPLCTHSSSIVIVSRAKNRVNSEDYDYNNAKTDTHIQAHA